MENAKQYIGYDYKEVIVSRKLEPVWRDGYANFGWELEKSQPAIEKHAWGPLRVMVAPLAVLPGKLFKNMVQDHESSEKAELRMKRNRKIKNKNELNRLQVSFETVLSEMERLEKSKTLGASVAAYIIGLLGTVCMALSTFCYLASNVAGCVGFAIPGFSGWIASYIAFVLIRNNREQTVNKEMEGKFDTVNDICMQAHEMMICEEELHN